MMERSSSEDAPPPQRRGRGDGIQSAIPPMGPRLLPLADSLTADMARETADKESFAAAPTPDFRRESETLVRYRMSTVAIARTTDRGARSMFLSDIRGLRRKAARQCIFSCSCPRTFHPVRKRRPSAKKRPYMCGCGTIRQTSSGRVGGYLKPNRQMANYASKDLANGRGQIPSYTPYIGIKPPPPSIWGDRNSSRTRQLRPVHFRQRIIQML